MLPTERISLRQAAMLLVTALTSTGHLLFVRIVAHYAGPDDWISLIAATLAYAALFLAVIRLVSILPGRNLVEISVAVTGPVVGRVLGLVFIWYFLHVGAMLVRHFGDFIRLSMPTTPLSVVIGVTLGLVTYAAKKGIETVARANDIVLPLLLCLGLMASVLLHKDKRYVELLPVLELGWAPVFRGGMALLGLFAEAAVFGMFGSFLSSADRPYHRVLWAVVVIGVLFIGPITGSTAVFGINSVQNMVYPTFEELKRIEVADFVANMDVVGVFLWTLGSFVKASVFLWAAATGLASLANLGDYRPVITPLSLIMGGLAILIGGNGPEVQRFLNVTYPIYGIAVGILLPWLLLALAWIRRPRHASGVSGNLGAGAPHQGEQ
ncbi:MAG TPA: endospore germination permease [Symbiobacteriaceae bacterium]